MTIKQRRTLNSKRRQRRADEKNLREGFNIVECVRIPKILHKRRGITVYFVRDKKGAWHWTHRKDQQRGFNFLIAISNRARVSLPSGLCAFYEHERWLAQVKIGWDYAKPGLEPERLQAGADRERYAGLAKRERARCRALRLASTH